MPLDPGSPGGPGVPDVPPLPVDGGINVGDMNEDLDSSKNTKEL